MTTSIQLAHQKLREPTSPDTVNSTAPGPYSVLNRAR